MAMHASMKHNLQALPGSRQLNSQHGKYFARFGVCNVCVFAPSPLTLGEKPAPTNCCGTIVEPSWAIVGPSWGTSRAPRCFDDTSTTLPRRDHVGVVAFVHIACLAALVATIMEAIVEVSWKRRG